MEAIFNVVLSLVGILLIVAAIGIAVSTALGIAVSTALKTSTIRLPKKALFGAAISGAALLLLSLSITIIPPGSVGVVTFLGSVQAQTLEPGIHLRLPVVNGIKVFETRIQAHQFADLDASSKENLSLKITGTMNYHIDGSNASFLYSTVSDDFAAKIIDPAFADYIKQVVPNYSADSTSQNWVLAHRDDIRAATKDELNKNLARYHIIVDDIYIANITNPDDYEASIRARQVAQQQVATEQQVTQQKIQQANQAVEVAKGQANAAIEQAKGEAQAAIEGVRGRAEVTKQLAEAQAVANALLSKSLSPELIQYNLVQKLSDKIQLVFLPSNGNFFLDPTKLLTQKPE